MRNVDHHSKTSGSLRRIAAGMLAAGCLAALSVTAMAADTAKVLIPASPGGGWDRTGRLTMQAMQKAGLVSGVQFTNRSGGAGTVGLTDFVKNYKGDDSALLVTGVIMMSSVITSKSPITIDMTTPLARLTYEYLGIAVPADSPIKTMADFVDALKKDPSGTTVAGSGVGSVEHLALALTAKANGVPFDKLNLIIFSGTEYVPALVSGQVKAVITGAAELRPLAEAGRVRIIGVTSEKRLPGVDVPTLKEGGLDVVVGNWRGIVGAPGMSDATRKEWTAKLDKLSKSDAWSEALKAQGLDDAYLSGPEFEAFLSSEQKRWEATLAELGLAK